MNNIYPIIGMSPGNSYFKDDVVKELIEKVIKKYGRAVVMIADIPAISTYIALGYPENRARRDKALPQGNALKNRVQRAIRELNYSNSQVRIIDWQKEIEVNLDYQEEYTKVLALYKANKIFHEAANDATKSVLEYSGKKIPDIESASKIGVHYLLSEFAFMEFAPKYLKADIVTYFYHKDWPIWESYIAGEFDNNRKEYLGFEKYTDF
jgi:cyclo(L-tyrosyl-L-tyrosyl) synthase